MEDSDRTLHPGRSYIDFSGGKEYT